MFRVGVEDRRASVAPTKVATVESAERTSSSVKLVSTEVSSGLAKFELGTPAGLEEMEGI